MSIINIVIIMIFILYNLDMDNKNLYIVYGNTIDIINIMIKP